MATIKAKMVSLQAELQACTEQAAAEAAVKQAAAAAATHAAAAAAAQAALAAPAAAVLYLQSSSAAVAATPPGGAGSVVTGNKKKAVHHDVTHRLIMDYVKEADYQALLQKASYKSRFLPQRAACLPNSKQQDLRRWNLHVTWADSDKVSQPAHSERHRTQLRRTLRLTSMLSLSVCLSVCQALRHAVEDRVVCECQDGEASLSATERHHLLKQIAVIYTTIRRTFLTPKDKQSQTNHRAKLRERRGNVRQTHSRHCCLGRATLRRAAGGEGGGWLNSACGCCRNIFVGTVWQRRRRPTA